MRAPALVLLAILSTLAPARAQQPGPPAGGEVAEGLVRIEAAIHGGKVHETEGHLVEVVLGPTWVRVYLLDKKAVSASVEDVAGQAALRVARVTNGRTNHQAHTSRLQRVAANPEQGRLRDSLEGEHALGNEDPGTYEVEVTLTGVAGEPHGRLSFTVTWSTAPADDLARYACAACAVDQVDPGPCKGCKHPLRRTTPGPRRERGARTPGPEPVGPRPTPPGPGPRPRGPR